MSDPIAYKYMADHHCPDCALKAWGRDEHGDIGGDAQDGEGNPIGVVAPWDEWQSFDGEVETLACGTCGVVIETFDGAAWLEAQARAITIEEEIQEAEGLDTCPNCGRPEDDPNAPGDPCDVCGANPATYEPEGGITPEGQALGHRYTMGAINAYCPQCSKEQGVTVLDCDYDLDK